MKQIRLLVSRAMNFPLFPASLVLLDCRGTAKTTRPDSSLLSDLCGKKWIGKYTLRPMGISHGTCFCFSRDCLGKKPWPFQSSTFWSRSRFFEYKTHQLKGTKSVKALETWDLWRLRTLHVLANAKHIMCIIYTYCERNKWKNQYL